MLESAAHTEHRENLHFVSLFARSSNTWCSGQIRFSRLSFDKRNFIPNTRTKAHKKAPSTTSEERKIFEYICICMWSDLWCFGRGEEGETAKHTQHELMEIHWQGGEQWYSELSSGCWLLWFFPRPLASRKNYRVKMQATGHRRRAHRNLTKKISWHRLKQCHKTWACVCGANENVVAQQKTFASPVKYKFKYLDCVVFVCDTRSSCILKVQTWAKLFSDVFPLAKRCITNKQIYAAAAVRCKKVCSRLLSMRTRHHSGGSRVRASG